LKCYEDKGTVFYITGLHYTSTVFKVKFGHISV